MKIFITGSEGFIGSHLVESLIKKNHKVKAFTQYHFQNYLGCLEDLDKKSLKNVNTIFSKMPEKCDPYVYYHRVRPYIFGTKDNPVLKKGLIYENQFDNKPQFFRGETGAQSSIIPF